MCGNFSKLRGRSLLDALPRLDHGSVSRKTQQAALEHGEHADDPVIVWRELAHEPDQLE
jgi:hypothetical protein